MKNVDINQLTQAWINEAKVCRQTAKRIEKVEPELAEQIKERAKILTECILELKGLKSIRQHTIFHRVILNHEKHYRHNY